MVTNLLEHWNIENVTSDLVTAKDYLRWGISRFHEADLYYGHGTDNALDEASYLISYCLGMSPEMPEELWDCRLTQAEKQAIIELLAERIISRKPAAYLTQESWFAGMPFFVDERVIVPRSPMAELIDNGFLPWIDELQPVNRVLDLCTGSGCLGIVTALAFPEAQVDAVDISEEVLAVAAVNVDAYGLNESLNLAQSNLFENLGDARYDVILSNPPYVSEAEYETLPDEYLSEPSLSLLADDGGLAVVTQILRQAAQHLTDEGVLFMEVGNSEFALVERYPTIPFTWLEFERGGTGVFLLTKQQLDVHCDEFV